MASLGNIALEGLWLGNVQVKSAWLGDKEIWSGEQPGPVEVYAVCFENVGNAEGTVGWISGSASTARTLDLQYSYDGSSWSILAQAGASVPVGGKMYVRAGETGQDNFATAAAISYASAFRLTGSEFKVSGEALSLLKQTPITQFTSQNQCAFAYAFYGCNKLVDASQLVLPDFTIEYECYSMFSDCYSLTAAPALPATNISSAADCYGSMFFNCTALSTPPAISAVNAADAYRCFRYMFFNCTALSSSPTILVTQAAADCYNSMFEQCTSLLSANDIAYAYTYGTEFQFMFANCTSIEHMSFSQWSRSDLVDIFTRNNMFSNVDASRVWVEYSGGAEWLSSLLPKTEIEGVKFTNVDLYGNTATVQITDVGDASNNGGVCDLVYSTDGQNWNTYNLEDVIYLQSQNDYVIFKASNSSGSGIKSVSDSSYYKVVVSQDNVLVEGDLAYLFSNDPENNYMEGDYQFAHLFENCSFVAYSNSESKYSSLKMPEEHTWMAVSYSYVFNYIFANATLARITIPVDSAGWTNGWSARDAYINWVYGISDGGQSGLMTLPSYFSIEYGDSTIPSGWSYETTN